MPAGRLALTGNQNETKMVSEVPMPLSITLKNIPEVLYQRLKASAERNRRSLNSEMLVCLEAQLSGSGRDVELVLARAKAVRDSLPQGAFNARDIAALKRAGRA